MLRILFLSALLALTNARTTTVRQNLAASDKRIIGGVKTTIEDLPYQVSVELYGEHLCGGSIISMDRVLTAAHCTAYSSRASSLTVRVGSTYRGSGGTVVQVESICDHPEYDEETLDNDVSVLRLSECLNTTEAIQPIALLKVGTSVAVGSLAVVSGWGRTAEGNRSLPLELQKVSVPKVSQEYCISYFGPHEVSDSMTCYGFAHGGKDSCQSDSGGPLAIGRIQVGVVSWGYSCAQPREPGVYADLGKPIIQDHVNSC